MSDRASRGSDGATGPAPTADEAGWAAADEDDLDDEERAALHAALEVSLAEAERGEVYPIEAVLAELAPSGGRRARPIALGRLAELAERRAAGALSAKERAEDDELSETAGEVASLWAEVRRRVALACRAGELDLARAAALLAVSPEEARRLVETAPGPGEAGAREGEAAWLAEVRRRVEELEAGLVPAIPWEEVRAEAEGIIKG